VSLPQNYRNIGKAREERRKTEREREREREREKATRSSPVSIRHSAADTLLNFRKLIKLAHVRYVRRTNKGDVETSCAIPARSTLVLVPWNEEGGTLFRPGKRENNGSNLGRSQCTTCWCFLADKAPSTCLPASRSTVPVARHKSAYSRARRQKPRARSEAAAERAILSRQCELDDSTPPNLMAPIGESRFFLSSSVISDHQASRV